MAWTRYDDGFPSHPKTLDVKASCRAALALHLLCNTWSASTSAPGFVPLAAVIEQGGGKAQGLRWARALVASGMWHAGGHDCARCPEPPADGYVIHDFIDYNPNEEVSRKRAEAGRKGAAARWGTSGKPPDDDGNGMANAIDSPPEPHAVAIAKNGIARGHPVPEVQEQRSSLRSDLRVEDQRTDVERLCEHLAHRIEANGSKRPTIGAKWREAARLMLDRDGRTEAQVIAAIDWCQDDPFWRGNILSLPKLRDKYDQLRLQAQRGTGPSRPAGDPYLNDIRDGVYGPPPADPQLRVVPALEA